MMVGKSRVDDARVISCAEEKVGQGPATYLQS